ncbi:hypothetical protein [uncultured Hoeflea sp.]|uniref:hypothetical protein n=1 Tax=uncultured Hoeflea sp. TaxID=538666 RepID=UPI0030DA14C2|tara:strand:+ start:5769 stop:6467 length:699 start_codon:yes stop_codon:yes gene_type:complete
MRDRNDFSLKSAIKMPLRDLLRGVSAFAAATNEAMTPAGPALPFSIRSPFLLANDAVGVASARIADIEIDIAEIAAASAALKAQDKQQVDRLMFCRVLYQAWSRLLLLSPSKHVIVSEIVVVSGFERGWAKPGKTPQDTAANIILSLRTMRAAGRFPGTPFPASPEEQSDIDLTLYATVLWLLADREGDIAEENRLLELAFAFSMAQKEAVISSLQAREALAMSLQGLAEQL